MAFVSQTSLFDVGAANNRIANVPCEAAAAIGDWVVMSASGVAYRALADSFANSNVLGVIEEKASATGCTVRVAGVTKPIFLGLDTTYEYFLSDTTPGGMTTIAPTGAGHVVLRVGQPFSATSFFVSRGQRMIRS